MSKRQEEPTPFLSRWSKRKRDVEAEAVPVKKETAEPPAADKEAEEAENRAVAEAVDVETLDYESDYEVFLKPGVPSDLRGAALQRLWRSNPVLANLDGMNEYDEDFRTPAGAAAAVVKTAWKVGKGFVDDEEETAATQQETQEEAEAQVADAEAVLPDSSVSTRLPEEAAIQAPAVIEAVEEQSPVTPEDPHEAPERPRAAIRARLDLDAFRER